MFDVASGVIGAAAFCRTATSASATSVGVGIVLVSSNKSEEAPKKLKELTTRDKKKRRKERKRGKRLRQNGKMPLTERSKGESEKLASWKSCQEKTAVKMEAKRGYAGSKN